MRLAKTIFLASMKHISLRWEIDMFSYFNIYLIYMQDGNIEDKITRGKLMNVFLFERDQ